MTWEVAEDKLGHRQGDILVALKNDGNRDKPQAILADQGKMHTVQYYWNPVSLAFEVATGGTTPGGDVNVTNFPSSYPITAASLPLPTGAATEATLASILAASGGATASRLDQGATYTWVGTAAAGTADASALWQIKRYDSATFSNVVFADGDTSFDNVWDNRASLSYS